MRCCGGLMRSHRRSRISGQRCISPEPAQFVPETHRKEVLPCGVRRTQRR
jgi:hypothetical protein